MTASAAEVEATHAHTADVNANPEASPAGRAGAAQAEMEATEAWQQAHPGEAAALDAEMQAAEGEPEVTGADAEAAQAQALAELLSDLGPAGMVQTGLDEAAPDAEAEAG